MNARILKSITMNKDHIRIFAANSHPSLAEGIAKNLELQVSPTVSKKFSCGEIYVRLGESVRGKEVFIVATCRKETVNEDLMELFLLCDAAKQSFARSIHVIVPFFGYSRQDKIHEARETISSRLMADLLVKSGANHVITIGLHSDQIQGFFDVPVDNLHTRKLMCEYFLEKKLSGDLVVVSPDAGGAKQAKKFADALHADLAIMHKNRPGHNVSEVTHVIGNVEGKTAILFDDMVDTAGSVLNARDALIESGAKKDVYLCTTHAVFSGPAISRLKIAGFHEIVVTNTIPLLEEAEKALPIHVLDIAPLLANVVQSVVEEKSASKWFS
ncbi:ribose-phosphate pyrophosphokinase [Candidatus Peregrinibacteria bacterium]|nr:ribose-phosphate pyrophosphokinase [Candidatus Peregrinibacteria bacterium]